jgi:hypothetical protein
MFRITHSLQYFKRTALDMLVTDMSGDVAACLEYIQS